MVAWILFAVCLVVIGLVFFRQRKRTKLRTAEAEQLIFTDALRNFVDKNGEARARGAEVLALSGQREVIQTLLRGRRDPIVPNIEDVCVERGLDTLCRLVGLDPVQERRDYDLKVQAIATIDELIDWFACPDLLLRREAMRSVAGEVQQDPSGELAERLLKMAFSTATDFNMRQRAAEALVLAGQEKRVTQRAVEVLEAEPDDQLSREDAVDVLTRFDAGVDAVPCLVQRAQEETWSLSRGAVKALTRLVRQKGGFMATAALESVAALCARPLQVSVAALGDPEDITVEQIDTNELGLMVRALLKERYSAT